jgi:predicted nucleotidyltransferase
MATAGELTAEQLAQYRAAARRQHQAERVALARREQLAWELARRAATLLRDQFRAERVVVFGSLVHSGCFTEWSDVDIAAAGIQPQDTLRAMELVQGLSTAITVNLVDLAACSNSLRSVVDREGIPL